MSAELRARLHVALDAFLDALDAYRAAPVAEELVKLTDVPIEPVARTRLVRDGQLRVVKIPRDEPHVVVDQLGDLLSRDVTT